MARGRVRESAFTNRRSFSTIAEDDRMQYSASGFVTNNHHLGGKKDGIMESYENPGEYFEIQYTEHKAKGECTGCGRWSRGVMNVYNADSGRLEYTVCPGCLVRAITFDGKLNTAILDLWK